MGNGSGWSFVLINVTLNGMTSVIGCAVGVRLVLTTIDPWEGELKEEDGGVMLSTKPREEKRKHC